MKKARNLGVNLLLFLGSVLLCLSLIELLLAIFWPHRVTAKPFFHIQSFFCQYHPLLGWVNKPGYRDIVTVDRDYRFLVTHNSKGLRDREHDYAGNRPTKRILVLGDSFAWGFGVKDEEVFSRQLEKATGIETINMGVSGYGTDQELLYYTEEGYRYKPDLVLLAFYANDIGENASSINYGYPKPIFNPDSEPLGVANVPVPRTTETERKLYGNPSTAFGRIKKFLRRNTHTYPFITGRLNSVPWVRKVLLQTGLGEDYERSLDSAIPLMQLDDQGEKWRLFFRLIREFESIARENRSEFLLVNIPIKEAPEGSPGFSKMDVAASKRSNDLISRALTDFTSQNNINFIDMLPPVRSGKSSGILYYSSHERDIHLSAEGHSLLAGSISKWLNERGWSNAR